MVEDEIRTVLVQLRLSPAEADALDDMRRHIKELPSRAEIIRDLIREAIAKRGQAPQSAPHAAKRGIDRNR